MNNTNRGANRLLIVIIAVLLIAAGAVAIALGAIPAVTSAWKQQGSAIKSSAPDWVGKAVTGTASLLVLGIILVALILIVLLIVFIVRQGGGHTSRVLQKNTSPTASTTIDLTVPRTLLSDHLSDLPELLTNRVTAYRVRRTPMLKISVRARRGIAPNDAADAVIGALTTLDSILGFELPAMVQISGGFRARSARSAARTA